MQVHLIITTDMLHTMKPSTKIIHDFGNLPVVFEDGDLIIAGKHAIVEDEKDNIVSWLKDFEFFALGNGSPMTEQFSLSSIDEEKV